jgi:hypothetical protein
MTHQTDTTTDSLDDHVPLFGRRVPVAALTLLLRLEDEGYDIRVDPETRELCIKPPVPAHARQAITRYKPYLILMVEQTLLLIERERVAEQDNGWSLA